MRYLSLFSGIEAASVAWEPLGWEPVAFCEIDAFPSAVLAFRYPEVPNLGDITEVDWDEFKKRHGAVDVIVGGSPCQSFSIAGGREGLDGESRLMYEYIRAVRELRPAWFLWENVPGVFSTDAGRAFGILLDEMDGLGYGLSWRVLDAQFFGVAQRRRRVFLVGHLGDMRAAAVLFEPDSVSGNTQSSKQKREELARTSEKCADSVGGNGCLTFDCRQITNPNDRSNPGLCGTSATLNTHGEVAAVLKLRHTGSPCAGGGFGPLVGEDVSFTISTFQDQTLFTNRGGYVVRRLTPRECERLQGFPDDWTLIPYRGKPAEECPDGPRYKACGNSMAVPVMRWIGERIQMVEDMS